MKINLSALWRAAAPIIVPVIVGLVTAKAQEAGGKLIDKARQPRA